MTVPASGEDDEGADQIRANQARTPNVAAVR